MTTIFRQQVLFAQVVNQGQLSVHMLQGQNLWRDVSVASFVLIAQITKLSQDVQSVSSQSVASAQQMFVPYMYVHDMSDVTCHLPYRYCIFVFFSYTFLYLHTFTWISVFRMIHFEKMAFHYEFYVWRQLTYSRLKTFHE